MKNSKTRQDGSQPPVHSGTEKKPVFREIEDVISVGALLRPSFVKAVSELSDTERAQMKQILIEVECLLANSSRSFTDRFSQAQDSLTRTYRFGPTWRFITGRIEQTWREVESPSVKELSIVSLLVGMLFEQLEKSESVAEFHAQEQFDSKKRRQAG
ncbi:MAG: hypothetical protein EOP09_10700 [Proteobacteria bacterium]|nr:MAG: hypothetical protein EOP09_10700 [Pseudomonadota bacterium]